MPNNPDIAVAARTFGNSKSLEGLRVKAGTRFAIGKPIDGLQVITVARYNALRQVGLVRPLNETDTQAAPAARASRARYTETAEQIEANDKAEAAAEKPKTITSETMRRPSARAAARRRTQEPDPPAPRRLSPPKSPSVDAPAGSQNGNPAPASSSAAGPASSTSSTSSKPRGRRRGLGG